MANTEKDAPALGPLGMLRWAWTQLTKMSTAMFLLLMLAVAAVPGSVYPQRIQDPTRVTDYIETHPTWGPIADKLQLFDVFSSFWFAAIYLLLFISLIGCVLPRAKKHWESMRKPPARTPKRLDRLPVHRTLTFPTEESGLSPQQAMEDARAILKKRGYRVDIRTEHGFTSVAAERGYLREVGNILFHTAMIGVLIGVAVGALFGYKGQKILVEGDTHVNSLISYDSFTPGTNYNPDWLEPYSVTLDKFTVEYDRQEDSPSYGDDISYAADLTFTDSKGKDQKQTLKVNEPVRVQGSNLYLSGNGYAPIIKVEDGEGNVAFEGPVVGLPTGDPNYTSSVVLKIPDSSPDQLGFVGMFLPTGDYAATKAPVSIDAAPLNPTLVLQSYYGDLGLDDGTPQNVYVLDTATLNPLNTMAMGNGIVLTEEANQAELPGNRGTITFEGYKRYVGLDVQYDPGQGLVLVSALLVFGGLIISLFVPRRRVWVTAQETQIDGTKAIEVEYALLARGEDPRLVLEADKLTDIFADRWGLEFGED